MHFNSKNLKSEIFEIWNLKIPIQLFVEDEIFQSVKNKWPAGQGATFIFRALSAQRNWGRSFSARICATFFGTFLTVLNLFWYKNQIKAVIYIHQKNTKLYSRVFFLKNFIVARVIHPGNVEMIQQGLAYRLRTLSVG